MVVVCRIRAAGSATLNESPSEKEGKFLKQAFSLVFTGNPQ